MVVAAASCCWAAFLQLGLGLYYNLINRKLSSLEKEEWNKIKRNQVNAKTLTPKNSLYYKKNMLKKKKALVKPCAHLHNQVVAGFLYIRLKVKKRFKELSWCYFSAQIDIQLLITVQDAKLTSL